MRAAVARGFPPTARPGARARFGVALCVFFTPKIFPPCVRGAPRPAVSGPRRLNFGRGGSFSAERLALQRQAPRRAVVHAVVRRGGKAHEIPQAVGELRKILRGPNVVNRHGLDRAAVPRGVLAAEAVAPQRLLAKMPPAFVSSRVVKHGQKCKKPEPRSPKRFGNQWLWLSGSGAYSATVVRRQCLQNSGNAVSRVVGSTRCCVGLPQIGHTSRSPTTRSISRFAAFCPAFSSIFIPSWLKIYTAPSPKRYGLVWFLSVASACAAAACTGEDTLYNNTAPMRYPSARRQARPRPAARRA